MAAIYEAYFDESGDFEQKPRVFCVSGYFVESENAREMDIKWRKVLSKHGLPYFHMVDCAHGVGVFEGKDIRERIAIQRKLMRLIKAYTLSGFSVIANAEGFERSERHPDEYSSCVSTSIDALTAFLSTHRIAGEVAYFFESGHKNKGRAYNHVAGKIHDLGASISFAEKRKVPLLQAADILAGKLPNM